MSIHSFRRPRVPTAASLAAVAAAVLLGLWISGVADAQQQPVQKQPLKQPPPQAQPVEGPPQDVILAPHRATYEMKLALARPNSGIVEVNGNMVLETAE